MEQKQGTGPLAGLRLIEMGTLLAGPFCGQLLGDFGAEVIKVEPPGQGDPMREWGREKAHGMSLWIVTFSGGGWCGQKMDTMKCPASCVATTGRSFS